jgi:ribosomal protein L29
MKKLDLKSTSVADLQKQKAEKSAELQKMRFNVSGRAKNHGMKELRRDVARINTELTARKEK